ncbi:MAG: TAT-variant-translocated molybdopterin oxidoreductase [Phycisphaerales bacterium]
MPSLNSSPGRSGRAYWRSVDQVTETVEFREWMHREFPAGSSEMLDGTERRTFLKVMGASFALAGLGMTGCRRWPTEEIVPATVGLPERTAGVPLEYASTVEIGGTGLGVLVKSYEGRPVKIEGNPMHPGSLGATDAFTQAMILDLYDPDRSQSPLKRGAEGMDRSSWEAFRQWATSHVDAMGNGAGVHILSEATNSPSVAAMRDRFVARFPQSTWHEYEPVNNDAYVAGCEAAFGSACVIERDLSAADVIVSLDADLFGAGEPDRVTNIRGWASRRRYESAAATPTRMYAFESDLTTCGAKADERLAVATSSLPVIASYLAAAVTGDAAMGALAEDAAAASILTPGLRTVLDAAADDLRAAGASGYVAAGRQLPASVQAVAHMVNLALGNAGRVIMHRRPNTPPIRQGASIAALATAVEAGTVETLFVLGANPVYNAPADLGMTAEAISGIANVVHVGGTLDETGAAADWHVNRAHALESWGDSRSHSGVCAVQQPLIEPLFGGKTPVEVLGAFIEGPSDGQSIAKLAFQDITGSRELPAWQGALHDGMYGDAWPTMRPNAAGRAAAAISELRNAWETARGGEWEIVFAPHPTVYDGRWANNGWMQELPDPMTKLTWDNAAVISPKAARELGVTDGDHITITVDGRSITTPVVRLPGVNHSTVVLHLGFGRDIGGRISQDVGVDVSPLRTVAGMAHAGNATVAKDSGRTKLAMTQDHHAIDLDSFAGGTLQKNEKGVGRLAQLVRTADWNEYSKHEDFAAHAGGVHVPHRLSMWDPPVYDGVYAWGMTIDLNACVGCNACITACQAENNIPVVGKEQVTRGREMHWLRIDRYFEFAQDSSGEYDADTVKTVLLQPMACVHCENAPCEQVCPVAATVHDHDGLNVMVYNRCIGTRYCSNNCPYKVRRFNYLDYHRRDPLRNREILEVQPDYFVRKSATPNELKQMQFNPDVTVRMRGVMEKCTYCTQRLQAARIDAKNAWARDRSAAARDLLAAEGLERAAEVPVDEERVEIPDGTLKTACQQACPAQAIEFGDLRDETAAVSRLHRNPRAYEVLEELHVKPRTKYLAAVLNPIGGGSEGHGGHGGGHGGDHDGSHKGDGHDGDAGNDHSAGDGDGHDADSK